MTHCPLITYQCSCLLQTIKFHNFSIFKEFSMTKIWKVNDLVSPKLWINILGLKYTLNMQCKEVYTIFIGFEDFFSILKIHFYILLLPDRQTENKFPDDYCHILQHFMTFLGMESEKKMPCLLPDFYRPHVPCVSIYKDRSFIIWTVQMSDL